MPDLIIKPAAQSGNKVIIQDQAGGAVLTTADSGATIANATLSGATGTLTAPTIASMANCTFPAGHVIQTQFTQYEGFAHMTGMGSHQNVPLIVIDGTAATSLGTTGILQVAITPKSNSKIKLECQWMGEYNGDNLHDSVWCIIRAKSTTYTRLDNSTSANSSTTNGYRGIQIPFRSYHSTHVGSTPEGMSFTYFDNTHTGDGTDEIIYKLAIISSTSSITDIYTNRTQQTDYYNQEMGISLISATEIAG